MLRLVLLRSLENYFRRQWLYLLPVIIMLVASLYYVSTIPKVYLVHGSIYVQDQTLLSSLTALNKEGFSYITPAERTVGEFYQLLNTNAFLRAIIGQTDLESRMGQGPTVVEETLEEVREAIQVEAVGDNLITINAGYEMPRIAQQLTAATVENYIQWKINLSRNESVAAQTFFVDLIDNYEADVEPARQKLLDYLRSHPMPVRGERPEEERTEIAQLQATVNAAEDRLTHAQDQEESARLALTQAESNVRQTYYVVDEPARPSDATRSKKQMAISILTFLAVGICFSGLSLVGGVLLDPSFRLPIDVQHILNLPVLTLIAETDLGPAPTQLPPASDERFAAHPMIAALTRQLNSIPNTPARAPGAPDALPSGDRQNGVRQNGNYSGLPGKNRF